MDRGYQHQLGGRHSTSYFSPHLPSTVFLSYHTVSTCQVNQITEQRRPKHTPSPLTTALVLHSRSSSVPCRAASIWPSHNQKSPFHPLSIAVAGELQEARQEEPGFQLWTWRSKNALQTWPWQLVIWISTNLLLTVAESTNKYQPALVHAKQVQENYKLLMDHTKRDNAMASHMIPLGPLHPDTYRKNFLRMACFSQQSFGTYPPFLAQITIQDFEWIA